MDLKMADFHKAFEAIDEDGSGEITVDELQHYMTKNNYKESFVSKWLTLFDAGKSGKITYKHYCDTLGLTPKDKIITDKPLPPIDNEEEMIMVKTVGKESAALVNEVSNQPSKQINSQSHSVKSTKNSSKRRSKPFSKHKRSLRASIKPGVILILLSGLHRGKKVVFLKQLDSGLLLVTGPYKLNGCPIRRVHQNMVIATRTQIDISDVIIPNHLNDEYFSRKENGDHKKINNDVNNIFAKTKKQYTLKEQRKQDQKEVDMQIIRILKTRHDKTMLAKYLRTLFTLSSHDYPHKMQF